MNSAFQSDSDSIPVKEFDNRVPGRSRSSRQSGQSQFINNPRIVRDELEDRYLSLSDENFCLKKQLRHHEERTKQLATRLVRLVGDKSGNSAVARRDTDFVLEEQKARIAELEGQVNMLRDKVAAKRQPQRPQGGGAGSFTKLVPTGPRKPSKKAPTNKTSRSGFIGGPSTSGSRTIVHSNGAIVVNDQVTQLLFEAKGENHALREQLRRLKEDLVIADKEILTYKEQLQIKDLQREDEMLAYRLQVESEIDLKKQKIAENMQLLRLQRDSRRTANWLSTYETQCHTLESSLSAANETVQQLEAQIAKVQSDLHEEQSKNLNLMKQLEEASTIINQMKEIETQIQALQEDNRILKEANDSLMSKALDTGNRIKSVEQHDDTLKVQIAQLEQTLRSELASKTELSSSLNEEKAKCLSAQQEIDALNLKCRELIEQLREAESKLSEGGIYAGPSPSTSQTQFVSRNSAAAPTDCVRCLSFETELNQSRWDIVQIRDELTKTTHLLKTQISINKEYQREIEVLHTKLEKAEAFHRELQGFIKVQELRTEQMLTLEKNLVSFNNASSKKSITPTTSTMTMTDVSYTCLPRSATQPPPVRARSRRGESPRPRPPQQESTAPYFIRAETPPPSQKPETKEVAEVGNPELQRNGSQPLEESPVPDDAEPTLEILIDKFEPLHYKLIEGLFATWEFEQYERKYSPVVSNGVFNTMSSHSFRNKRFPIDGIEIQIHQAIGDSDCRTLASGFLQIGSNLVSPIYSVSASNIEENKLLGHLHYSCIIENFDGENNNIYEQRKPYHEKQVESNPVSKEPSRPAAPVPVLRRKSDVQENRIEIQVEIHEPTPSSQNSPNQKP